MKAATRLRPPASVLVALLCCACGVLGAAPGRARPGEDFDSRWRNCLVRGSEAAGECGATFLRQLPVSSGSALSILSEAFLRACGVIPDLAKRGVLSWPENPAGPELESYPARQETPGAGPGPVPQSLEALPEIRAYVTDLRALTLLARYHVRKDSTARSLALFEQSGDVKALRSAEAHARAAADLWERLSALIVLAPGVLFASENAAHCFRDLQVSRGDLALVTAVGEAFRHYGLLDAALRFGPERSSARDPLSAGWPQGRFRALTPAMWYNRERGFGWLSLQPAQLPATSGLRGSGKATLAVDLTDGDYRVVTLVENQPELASGSFQIRSGTEAITYAAGETGEKSMTARVSGGRLDLSFSPDAANEWLVNALVITRRAPHIGWIPPQAADHPGFTVDVTATAPDGIAEAAFSCTTPEGGHLLLPLAADGAEYRAAVRWPARWRGKHLLCHVTAVDRRGTSARLPASGEFAISVR